MRKPDVAQLQRRNQQPTIQLPMALLDRLIRDARKAMQMRGHKPATAIRFSGSAVIKCESCDKDVQVICKPQPNEIQIGGEAVALNCNVATNLSGLTGKHDIVIQAIEEESLHMHAVMGC